MEPLDPHLFGPDQQCFGCGPTNPHGMRLQFFRDGNKAVVTTLQPREGWEGPPRVLHGGIQATLADEIAAWTVIGVTGCFGFTTSMQVRYLRPTRLHTELHLEWLRIPSMPVGVLGTAVSFYMGFKGSAAYDRMWEARKIWGGIVNSSRTWGTMVTTFVTNLHRETPGEAPPTDIHRELLYRHVAWLAALRIQLRRPKPWEHRKDRNDRFRQLGKP